MNTFFLGVVSIPIYCIALNLISLDKKSTAEIVSLLITFFIFLLLAIVFNVHIFDKEYLSGGFLIKSFHRYSLNTDFIKYFLFGLFTGGVLSYLTVVLVKQYSKWK